MTHREGTLVQGLNLYKKKGWGPQGRFHGLGARKTQKTTKLRKRSEAIVNKLGLKTEMANCELTQVGKGTDVHTCLPCVAASTPEKIMQCFGQRT